jgi:1-acyl-sn-glycerol-3-phosphate acyltransferase
VAPCEAIPLRHALRLAGIWRITIRYWLQRAVRAIFAPLGLAFAAEQLDFLRYSCTISREKLVADLQVAEPATSWQALAKMCGVTGSPTQSFDDFGIDPKYIRSCGRWQLRFMESRYWRVEVQGLEHVPRHGGAVLAGMHRGFMPFDGVMMVHLMSRYLGRVPRFLMHPGLIKFPHLARFLTRLGGVIACQENADRVLGRGQMLGVFPEGIRGAFRLYGRDVYRLGRTRDDYVTAALRHRVPIIPFVTLGPAETFPILAKVEWSWWKRYTHWPFFPITPTGNLVPLPTKWHIQLLRPIDTAEYADQTLDEVRVVQELSRRVRLEMQAAIDGLLKRRKSIFFSSLRGH